MLAVNLVVRHVLSYHMKQNFLDWLAADTGLKDFEITEQMGQSLASLFEEIESELDRVTAKDLDPRYVHLFLLEDS